MMVPRVPPGLFSIDLSSIDDVLRARLHSSHLQSTPSGPAARPAVQALAALAGWAVLTGVMDLDYRFAAGSALLIVLGGMGATLVAGLAFALRPLSARPARVLRAQD